jgi:hypothetical protein
MTVRRGPLVLGLVLVGLVVLFAVPGNGILETRQYQPFGTILAHLAMLLVLWSVFPALRGLVPRLDDVSVSRLGAVLVAIVVTPLVVLTVMRLAGPQATYQLITREWGIVEPLQVAFYAIALALCRAIRGTMAEGDPARDLYAAGAVVMGVFMLEETDYLGVLNLIVRGLGAHDGRFGRKHIGGLHDILDAGGQTFGIAAVGLVVVVGLAGVWMALGRYRTTLVEELRSRSAVPLALAVLALVLAEIIDFDDQLVAWLPGLKVLEEPLELACVIALNAALVLRLQVARSAAGLSTLVSGPRDSGAAAR